MRALTIRNPYAALVAHGYKGVETRPAPPAGDMCPPGARPLPGARLNRGDLLLIHAGVAKDGPGRAWRPLLDPLHPALLRDDVQPLPLGAVIASARLTDVVPIVGQDGDLTEHEPPCIEHRPRGAMNAGLWRWPAWEDTDPDDDVGDAVDISDELDYGDWTPGRWAWLLSDVHRLAEPVPCKGRQGVWIVDYPTYHQVVPQLPEAA